jgi:hypothetical protein
MDGPFELNADSIDAVVPKNIIGNYALGNLSEDKKKFIVGYVGRSDSDLNERLKQHVGEYTHFKFSGATSVKEAFEKECHNYHDFTEGKTSQIHPARPEGDDWQCPRCGVFRSNPPDRPDAST